jgi:hypothetical protein
MVTMTKERAIAAAKRSAKRSGSNWFVVYEGGGFGYQPADLHDLNTFFAGQDALVEVWPDGTVDDFT